MFVLDSALYLPDHEPPVSAEQHGGLGLGKDELLILVVANPGASGTTVNLMAPIVLNRTTVYVPRSSSTALRGRCRWN